MLRTNLCHYSNSHILESGTVTVVALETGEGNNDIQVVFNNFAPFTSCISETNNK